MTVLQSLLSTFRRSRASVRRIRREKQAGGASAEALEARLLLTNPDPFSSLAGAGVTVYLDFDGHTETDPDWTDARSDGNTGSIVTPAFDTDGTPASFSNSERELIENIFQRVAEDFRPFDINVTTVDPGTFTNAQTVLVSIGGDGDWSTPVGLTPPPNRALVGGFSDVDLPQTVFVFPTEYSDPAGQLGKNLAAGVSEAVAVSMGLEVHEAPDDSRLVGSADVGPILGNGTGSVRDVWVNEPGTGTVLQDDLATLVSNPNVRYRTDDHGDAVGTATAISVGAGTETLTGVISENTDVDSFFFSTTATSATITVTGLDLTSFTSVTGNDIAATTPGTNLDPVLRLLDGTGTEIAIDDGAGLSGSITASLPEDGYFIEISNGGQYGNLGEYAITIQGVDTPQVLGNPVLLESLPGAPVTIYLDYNGHVEADAAWIAQRGDGSTAAIVNPAYNTDADPLVFGPAEINAMREIFYRIAEDFRPFNVNVSTLPAPSVLVDGQSMLVAIGGDGAWSTQATAVNLTPFSFINPTLPNSAFVFSDNASTAIGQHGKEIAYSASSRIGSMLGLDPHLEYIGSFPTGNRHPGTAEVGPLLGAASGSQRDIWTDLPGTNPSAPQDDLALITEAATNGIEFRLDDHAGTTSQASPIAISTGQEAIQGVIESNTDVDVFSFQTLDVFATIRVSGMDLTTLLPGAGITNPGANLDPFLTLRDESGAVLATDDVLFIVNPATSHTAEISMSLAAGTYFIEVSNREEYGNLGEYTITIDGVDVAPVTLDAIPTAFREDEGPNASIGRVFRPTTQNVNQDLVVQLVSTDTTELTVPAQVTIPAGRTSATFPISAVDDTLADGAQTVEIQALVNGVFHSDITVTVQDHEFLTVAVNPDPVREDAGPGGATLTVTRSNTDVGPPNHFIAIDDRVEEYDQAGNLVSTLVIPWHGAIANTGGSSGVAGTADILVVSDSDSDDANISAALMADGHTVTVVINDFLTGNSTLRGDLSQYDAVYWSATGTGFGAIHTDNSLFQNLEAYVQTGGHVFVTGYDSVASPTDSLLISFLGATGSVDLGGISPGPVSNVANSLTTGVVDIRGVTPLPYGGSFFFDLNALTGLTGGTVGLVPSGFGSGFQWTLRSHGTGEIAYVSNGEPGGFFGGFESPSWLDTSVGGLGAYNAALRNFAFVAADSSIIVTPVPSPNVPRPVGEVVHDLMVLPNGNLAIYNGTDSGALSHYNVAMGEWSHYVIPGLSTETGNGPTGGISSLGDFVFMTDMEVNSDEFGLVRLDLRTGEVIRFGVEETGFRLFSNNRFQDMLVEVDPVTGAIVNELSVPAGVAGTDGGLAFDGTTLWALDTTSDTIYGLNPDTGELLSTHVLNLVSSTGVPASGFTGLAALNGLLYVLDAGNDNTIYGYNPTAQTATGSFPVGAGSGQGIVLDGGLGAITGPDALLVANLLTDQVYVINSATGEITDTINTGITRKTGLASANGEIFVGDFDSEDIAVFGRDGQALRTLDVNSVQVAFGSLALGGDDVPGTIRTDSRFIDVTVGLDDVVYGLSGNQTTVRRYSASSLVLLDTINLAAPIRTITVDELGVMYGGDDNGDVFAFNPDGSVLRTASSGAAGLADIQINVSHELLLSDAFGQTSTTDADFTSFAQLETVGGTSFVSFARHQSQPTGDLIVTLQFDNPDELDIPATVTIPVNQQSVTVSIDVLDDFERDGTEFVTINASAPSYDFGTTTVSVLDAESVGVDVIPDSVVEGVGEIAAAVRVFRTDVDGPLTFVSSETGAVTTAVPLLDNDVTLSRITIAPQISRVTDVNVTLNFVHMAIPDLDVFLFSPSGTRVELFTDLNSNASNLTNTTFDDEAGQRIVESSAPYTGRFVGESFLDKFDGENPSGDWTLEIVDDNQTDTGTLISWSLELTKIGLSAAQVTLSSSDTTEAVTTTTVTIPENQAEVLIPLESIDDSLLDGTQTAVISVVATSLSGLTLGSDVVDVTDNEELLIALDKTLVTEGDGPGAIRGTVTRSDTGGNSSLVVALLSSDTSEISVPASVTIPMGETSISFDVDAVDDLVFDGTQLVTFTASSPGYVTTTSPQISVADQESRLQLTTLSDNVAEDAGFLTVSLARLDVNDLTVAQSVILTSSDETELTVPALVVIPSGAVSTTFTATILGDAILDGSQVVTITAADANTANPGIDAATKDITVDDAEFLSVTVPAGSERILENAGAGAVVATVSISTSGHTSPLVVDLSNSDLSEASIPQQVIIPVGDTSATFLIDAVNDDFIDRDQAVMISADAAGYRTGILDLTVADHEPPILAGPAFETEDPTPALTWSPVDGATRYDLWLNDVSRNIVQLFRMDNIPAPAPLFSSNFQGGPFNVVVDGVNQTLPFDPALWDQNTVPVATQDVAADNLATNAAAGIVSAHLDEAPNGVDRLQSVSMDISGELGAQLKYTFQRNTPATPLDPAAPPIPTPQLVLSYRNSAGEWVILERQFPDQVALDGFVRSKVQLPADALHSDFAFRFETIGASAGAEDDWFIGEVELTGYPNVIPDQQIGVGRYRFWVRAYDDLEQAGFWSQGRDFRVLTRPEITSPASHSVSASDTFPEISWTTVVDTDHYELWVNNVTTGEIQAIYETNLQTTSFASAAANLPGGTYEAWTRAIGPDGLAGLWSNSVTFSVLSAPQNITPTGATFDRTPEIRWDPVVGASHYYVWLTLRNPGEAAVPVLVDQFVTGTTRVPNTDLADGNYVVWVQAISEDDTRSAWSTGVEFSIGGRPEILTPTQSETTSSTPTFLWTGITGAERYEIWINRIDVAQSQVVHDANVSVASYTVQTPLVAGEYRVWVRAISEMGEDSFWSKPVNFTVAVLPSRNDSRSALPDGLLSPGNVSEPAIQLTVSERVSAVVPVDRDAALSPQTAVTVLTSEETAGPAADGVEAVEDLDSVMSDWAMADWWSGTIIEEEDSKDSTPAVAALGLGILATQPVLKKTVGKKQNRV